MAEPVPAVPVAPAAPTDTAVSTGWMPDQNVLRGGLVAVIVWAILAVANRYGLDVPVSIQAALPGVIGWVIIYVLPPSAKNIAKRLNDRIVALAAALPSSKVSAKTVVLPDSAKVVSVLPRG